MSQREVTFGRDADLDINVVPGDYRYETVAAHITRRIETGRLQQGAMLPNERRLATEYGVSVGTVRKAAQLLQERGLIRIRRSTGTFVCRPAE